MKCFEAIQFIYKTRIFESKTPNSESASAVIAVQFSLSVARDDVLSSGHRLKGITAKKLFGTGDDVGIYVNPILPPPVHKLSIASRKHARDLNYARPIIRPSAIFMRRTLSSELIPISSTHELSQLSPNTHAGDPTAD